jgi:hypothetical protein
VIPKGQFTAIETTTELAMRLFGLVESTGMITTIATITTTK